MRANHSQYGISLWSLCGSICLQPPGDLTGSPGHLRPRSVRAYVGITLEITDTCTQKRRTNILSKRLPKFLVFSATSCTDRFAFFGNILAKLGSISP